MTNIIETLKLKLSSGNDVPVSRISLTREEAEAVIKGLEKSEFTWPKVEDYAKEIRMSPDQIGLPFKMGWEMARTTNSFLRKIGVHNE